MAGLTSGFDELFVFQDDKNQIADADIPKDFLIFSQSVTEILKQTPSDLKRLVSKECSEIQQDEMLALKAIFEKDLSYIDDDCKCFKITISDEAQVQDIDQVIDLWFSIPANYPNDIPIFEVEGHGGLSLTKADQLYELLLEEAYRKQHETMIFDLICIAKEFVSAHLVPKKQAKPVLEECKDDEEQIEEKNEEDQDIFYYSPHFSLKPTKYTGPIHRLLEKLPKDLQVVSIENILKADLVAKFTNCNESFQLKYASLSRKNPQKYILEPCLGFHGTSSHNMPSIVRSGLKVPGQASGVGVAHGSRFGTGIYLSPSASYSLSYSDESLSLLVCTVILGKCLKLSEESYYDEPDNFKNVDSVISPNQMEMVAFDAAQVLPCFIIRLANKGSKKDSSPIFVQGAYSSSVEKYVRKDETPKEKLERLQKRACKWLPHGYGPSNKIEDVADSDDDEEEYGQYQTFRYENAKDIWDSDWR